MIRKRLLLVALVVVLVLLFSFQTIAYAETTSATTMQSYPTSSVDEPSTSTVLSELAPSGSELGRAHEVGRVQLKPSSSTDVQLEKAEAILMSDGSTAFSASITPSLHSDELVINLGMDIERQEYSAILVKDSGSLVGVLNEPDNSEEAGDYRTHEIATSYPTYPGTYQRRAYLRTIDPVQYVYNGVFVNDSWLTETRNLVKWYVDAYSTMSLVSTGMELAPIRPS